MKKNLQFLLLSFATIAIMPSKAQTTYPQLTNIPSLYINTDNGNDPKDKVTYLPCTIRYVDGTTMTTYTMKKAKTGIRGRGNSTWDAANKKPWRIKLENKAQFIGPDYAKAKDWTLLANAFDKSLMRNALTYYLGKFVGLPFCPAFQFVDLVMNGKYKGTYQISDQMEVNPKRVNINSETGWMLEYANDEAKVDAPKISTNYGWVQIKNPGFTNDDFTTNQPLANDINTYLNTKLANAIKPETRNYAYIDPNTGYRSLVDATTLINWYIATEITANWDGFYSVYTYREADGPLCIGPMWDEDLAYGNHSDTYNPNKFSEDYYQKLLADNNSSETDFRKLQPVIAHLYDDPWFTNAVYMRFNELWAKGINKELTTDIENLRKLLSKSAAMNYTTWKINSEDMMCVEVQSDTWDGYVDKLKDFINYRLSKLKTLFANKNTNNRYLDENTDYPYGSTTTTRSTSDPINAIMNRTAKAGMWNTVCFPFSMDKTLVEYMFGIGTIVEEFSGVTKNNDGSVVLNFKTTNSVITSGVPCLVRPTRDMTVPYVVLNVSGLLATPKTVTKDGYSLVGVFSPKQLDSTNLFVGTGNTILTPSATSGQLKGYRAYFVLPATNPAKVSMIFDGTADGIHLVNATSKSIGKIYNLHGQVVGTSKESLSKGVYIVDGKKVIIK